MMATRIPFSGRPTLRIVGTYLLFSIVWIWSSDRLLLHFIQDPSRLTELQNYKGWAFVGCSAALLYVLIRAASAQRDRYEAALRNSEIRYADLYENAPDMFVSVDPTSLNVVHCNRTFVDALGLAREEIIGRHFYDLYHTNCASRAKRIFEDFVESGQVRDVELELRRKDGSPLDVSLNCAAVRDAQGKIVGSRAVLRDITERRRAEEESRRHGRELQSLSDLISATATTLELQPLLDHALRGALDLTGLEGGTLCLIHKDDRTLRLATSVNASEATVRDLTTNSVRIGECLCGNCAETGQPLILWDNASGSEYATREATRNEGIRFHAAFPLSAKGEPLGVLCLFSRDDRKPAQHGLDLVKDLCGAVALAIANARLYEAERTARDQLSTVFERVTDGFVALDRTWCYTYVNRRAAEIFGRQVEYLLGKRMGSELPNAVRETLQRGSEEAMAEQRPVLLESYDAPRDRWFESLVHPSPDGVSIYFHDITERRRTQDALQRERDFSNAVLDSLPGVFYMTDAYGQLLRWNTNLARVTGYDDSVLAQKNVLDFFEGHGKSLVAAGIHEVFNEGTSEVEADFEPGNGVCIPYYLSGRRTQIDGMDCMIGVGIDISERRRMEIERNRLFNLSIDMLCVFGFDGSFRQLNPAWTRVLEWTDAELIGRPWIEFVHPDDRAGTGEALAWLESGEPVLGFENRFQCRDGSYRWVSWNAFPLPAERLVFAVARDITEKHVADETLRRSGERLQILSNRLIATQESERRHLARELHDEIGQALTAAKITLQGLQQYPDPATQGARLSQAVELIDRLLQGVRNLSLNLRPPMLDDLGLAAGVRWLLDQQARNSGIQAKLECSEFDQRLDAAVETACFRVAQEALTNVVRHAHATEVAIELRMDPAGVWLTVRDNGAGFDVNQAQARAARGSSLGLLGMEERAALLGGKVEITSTLNEGTEVSAWIPNRPSGAVA